MSGKICLALDGAFEFNFFSSERRKKGAQKGKKKRKNLN